jgi:hypothetical protein
MGICYRCPFLFEQHRMGRANSFFSSLRCLLPTYPQCTREWLVSPNQSLGISDSFKKLANKPPRKERYDDDNDKSTTQCFQLMMTISYSNAVTTINNATYQEAQ